MSQVKWYSSQLSHQGNVRDYNEDACVVIEKPKIWCVADGMGGHEAGDVASNMIMLSMQQVSESDDLSTFVDNVDDALTNVNLNLRQLGKDKYNNRTIGSTVVTMISAGIHIAYLWAGDSRLYRVRNNEIKQLTTDHSEVQNLIEQGLLLPEEAETHPSANVITRAIGAGDNLYLSVGVDEIEDGDIYLLCSDGLYRDIKESEFLSLILQSEVTDATQQLMNLALSREAKDNITIVIAKCVVDRE